MLDDFNMDKPEKLEPGTFTSVGIIESSTLLITRIESTMNMMFPIAFGLTVETWLPLKYRSR
jgi:hypothetical protein